MTDAKRVSGLSLWMTACAVPALLVLIGLGIWQLQRLEWKQTLIAERTAQLTLPRVEVSEVPAEGWQAFELRRVRVRGTFLHDKSIEISSRSFGGRPGVHIVTPMRLADNGGFLLINRGWAPPENARRAADFHLPAGELQLTGILRAGSRSNDWVPDNEPANGIWFYADPPAMAASIGLPGGRPYLLEAVKDEARNSYPVGGQTVTTVRNNHLQYAITWFGLAVALIAIYVLYHVKRRA